MRTALCDLLGIDVPIVQAPIGSASVPALAAAVANAGGLGMLALTWTPPERIGEILAETRALTKRPVGVNLILAWDQEERLDAALAAGAKIVSLGWGDPSRLVGRVHDAGGKLLVTVGSAEEGRRMAEAGADAIVAQGWEAGGHVWGTVATMALVPAAVDAVAPVPVVAAGGVADGRGLAAALALGAAGAWIGTRFLLAEETPIHARYRARLLEADETETVYSELFDVGWPDAPHRALRNATIETWERAGRPAPGERPGEGETIATTAEGNPTLRYSSSLPLAGADGDIDALSLWSGQGVGLVDEIRPAAEIVARLMEQARQTLHELDARS